MRKRLAFFLGLVPALTVAAGPSPFSVDFFQNKLWRDGRAEVSVYEAEENREGMLRKAEVRHIVVREPFSPISMVKTDHWQMRGTYDVFKLNQILHIPVGTFEYNQMHSSFWRVDSGKCIKFSLASIDSCGNTYKEGRVRGRQLNYSAHTYWEGMDEIKGRIPLSATALFYDELPLKLRSLNWKEATAFSAGVIPTIIGSRSDVLRAIPTDFTIEHQPNAKTWQVRLTTDSGKDVFDFEDSYPYGLRDWKRADGSSLHLKSSVRIPYWKLNQPGDEKYLSEPYP